MGVPTMTLATLRSQARFFALGDSSSTSFSDADTLVAANDAYQQAMVVAFEESGEWQFRGDNSATQSITAATRAYTLPTSFLRILRVDIKYPGGSDYVRAVPIDRQSIDHNGLAEFTSSTPVFDLQQGKLEIFVSDKTASISAVTDGIIIYYDDEITALAATGDIPEIPKPFARYMGLLMALDYCIAHQLDSQVVSLQKQVDREEARFRKFISNRSEAKRSSLNPRREDYGEMGGMINGTTSINPSK